MSRLIVGLTGQTGAGKTTATDFFKEQGFSLINCDELVHSLGDESREYIEAVRAYFGEGVVTTDNKINRKALGQIVFSDKEKLEKLNEIVFPIIGRAMTEKANSLFENGSSVVILDAPTLFESETDKMCGLIVAITAEKETLINRIMKRDGISRETAEKRLSSQRTKEFFTENSDYIIDNSTTKEAFVLKLRDICDIIREKADEN